ncbi:MAG: FAD-dependent oxidoreductase, partial [Bacteroidales bacterium]|nr:FAD-dependent oxidoreductase [Bacteroidales bacterium]
HMNGGMPRCCHDLKLLLDKKCTIINGAIFCGVEVVNKQLKSITVCENGKLIKLNAKITIDATGDGDVASLAGEGYGIGDSRMGITQNYSQWDVRFRPKERNFSKDYDLIDINKISELQRGFYISHYESHYYDFLPMLTVRESRRPNGLHTLDLKDIYQEVSFEDTISQARSDFDPHYFVTSEFSRCALLLPHFDHDALIDIPYRCIVPKTIDGLLLSGKAISQTYKALQFTRMSADIMALGYVTGLIACEVVKQGVQPRNFSVTGIQKELKAKFYLPENTGIIRKETPQEMVTKLAAGDATYLLKCCLEEKSNILMPLETAFTQNKTILLAKALAWFGKTNGLDLIIKDLSDLFEEEQRIGHPKTYYEQYKPTILYWRINQDIGLLAMAGSEKSDPLINNILKHTTSGGKMVPGPDTYHQGRIDVNLVPFFHRILNVCFYIERNPNKLFSTGLEALLDDPNLGGYLSKEYQQARWRVYGGNLELLISAAAARSGSKKGIVRLIDYLSDCHSSFRSFAHKELVSIFKKDFKFEAHEWTQFVNKTIKVSYGLTPLKKDVEV